MVVSAESKLDRRTVEEGLQYLKRKKEQATEARKRPLLDEQGDPAAIVNTPAEHEANNEGDATKS